MDINWKLFNVIILGLGFNLIHIAFYASSMSAKFVTDAIKNEIQNSTEDQGKLFMALFFEQLGWTTSMLVTDVGDEIRL